MPVKKPTMLLAKESKMSSPIKKIKSWLKKNWLLMTVFLVAVLVVYTFIKLWNTESAYQSLFEKYHESIRDHQTQIEQLRSIQQGERQAREEQYRQFIEEIKRIEHQYKAELSRIESARRNTQTRIIEEAARNPDTLTERIKETFGIPIEGE